MWRFVWIIFLIRINLVIGKLSGDHICLTEETFLVNVTESYIKNATVRNYQWCYNVPPRCSYYTVKQVTDTRIVEKNDTRNIETCCPGFVESNDECVSSCRNCKNGVCENGNCNCSPGYKGQTCNLECSTGEWGPNCLKFCNCSYNKCDSKTGNCLEKLTTVYIEKKSTVITTTPVTEEVAEITRIVSPEESFEIDDKYAQEEINQKSTKLPQFELINYDISTEFPVKIIDDKKSIVYTTSTQSTEKAIEELTNNVKQNTTIESTLEIIDDENITAKTIPPTEKPELFPSFTVNILNENNMNNEISANKSNSDVNFSNTPIATKEGLLIPVEIQYDANEIHKPTTYSSAIQDKNYISNEEYLNRQISNNNFSSNDFALFGITVLMALMLVITILSVNFLRKKRKKVGVPNGKQGMSVFSASIFHSPLPEPPVTENPLYLNPIKCQNGVKEFSTFESRIVCNVNGTRSHVKDTRELEYDHPPSTGNFRKVSLIGQLDEKKNQLEDYVIEPLYDEIPQNENDPHGAVGSNYLTPMSIYINTCGRTKF